MMKTARYLARIVVVASLLILLGASAIPALATILPAPPMPW
jgi:hypothetical protein